MLFTVLQLLFLNLLYLSDFLAVMRQVPAHSIIFITCQLFLQLNHLIDEFMCQIFTKFTLKFKQCYFSEVKPSRIRNPYTSSVFFFIKRFVMLISIFCSNLFFYLDQFNVLFYFQNTLPATHSTHGRYITYRTTYNNRHTTKKQNSHRVSFFINKPL